MTELALEEPRFYAGWRCLDFANTVEPRQGPVLHDFLPDCQAVLGWARDADLLAGPAYRRLARAAKADPSGAAAAHARAIELRETCYRLFSAIADGRSPRPADLSSIHAVYVEALQRAVPRLAADRLVWNWPDGQADLDQPRLRLAADAVELLRSGRQDRIKTCPPRCAWLFVDSTKNRSRRWCSMQDCGTGEKIRRQAARRAGHRP